MAIFRRSWRLSVEVEKEIKIYKELSEGENSLKIEFDTTAKNSTWAEGNITLYNLDKNDLLYLASCARANSFKANKITLEAGYGGDVAVILNGNIQRIDCDFKSADRKASFKVQGNFANNLANASISVSKQGNVDLSEVCKELSKIQKLKLTYDSEIKPVLLKGFSFLGTPMALLNELRQSFKDYYFILSEDGNELKVQPRESKAATNPTTISEDTGLVGVPTPTQYGLSVTTLLNANFHAGAFVDIESSVISQYNGTYKIFELRHRGGNQSSEWNSVLDLRKVG